MSSIHLTGVAHHDKDNQLHVGWGGARGGAFMTRKFGISTHWNFGISTPRNFSMTGVYPALALELALR